MCYTWNANIVVKLVQVYLKDLHSVCGTQTLLGLILTYAELQGSRMEKFDSFHNVNFKYLQLMELGCSMQLTAFS